MESTQSHVGIRLFWLIRRCRQIDKELSLISGLSADELHCLAVVSFKRPSHLRQLSMILGFSPPRTSKVLKGLERQGLVHREPHPSDRRKADVVPTRRGVVLLDRAIQHLSSMGSELLHSLPGDRVLSSQLHQVAETSEQPFD